jgi:hypothetical protein
MSVLWIDHSVDSKVDMCVMMCRFLLHTVNFWPLLSHAECVGVVFCIMWYICLHTVLHDVSWDMCGLWMSLQGYFYEVYVAWVMWGICPAHRGCGKPASECPNQKTVFCSHILLDTSSQLINVKVCMSEGGEYKEESTTWVQCCLELELVTFAWKAWGCPLELTGRHPSVRKHSTPVSVFMYCTEVSHLPDVTLCESPVFLL